MKLISQAVSQYVSFARHTIVWGCQEEMVSLIVHFLLPKPDRNLLLHSPFALQSNFSEMGGRLAWYPIVPILQIAIGGFRMPRAILQANEESNLGSISFW